MKCAEIIVIKTNLNHLFTPNVFTQKSVRAFLFSEPTAICCTPKILNFASLSILEVEKSLIIIL
jgi:hypothetical protein